MSKAKQVVRGGQRAGKRKAQKAAVSAAKRRGQTVAEVAPGAASERLKGTAKTSGLEDWEELGLTAAQHAFCLAYLENGFNATRAYEASHQGASILTCATEGSRTLRNPKVRGWLNPRLEKAWQPLQMGGEQALGRIGLIAVFDPRDLFDAKGKLLDPHLWPDSAIGAVRSVKDGPYGLTVTFESAHSALRTILEQSGKLRDRNADSLDALAEAIRDDRKRHGIDPPAT